MALTDNLLSYYRCDEASGNLLDAHGSVTFTDNNTVGATTGKILGGRSFNGTNEYFSRSGNFGGGAASGGAFSVSLWLTTDQAARVQQVIGRFAGGKLFQLGQGNSGEGLRVAYGVSPFNSIQVGSNPTAGQWYHVVFTFSSSGVGKLYVNGTLIGTAATLTGAFNDSTDINIGRRGGDGTEYWDGNTDEIGWWSRELASGEVTQLYNSGNGLAYPFSTGVTLTADAGSFTLGGQAATLTVARKLTAESGSYTLTGQAASLVVGRKVSADAGSYALSGQDASLTVSRKIAANSGSFTLTGTAATLKVDRRLSADSGSYTLTGQDTALNVGGNKSLSADSGSFALTGQVATLRLSRVVSAVLGEYSLTGQAATLQVARRLSCASGAYVLTGQDAGIAAGEVSTFEVASIVGGYYIPGATAGQGYAAGARSGGSYAAGAAMGQGAPKIT